MMVNLYFGLKIFIPVILICSFLLFYIVLEIKFKLDSKFKKNGFVLK